MDDFLDNYEILGGKMRPVLPGDSAVDKLETMRRAMGIDNTTRDTTSDNEESTSEVEDEQQMWDCETILSVLNLFYLADIVLHLHI